MLASQRVSESAIHHMSGASRTRGRRERHFYRLRKILESAGAKGWLETVSGFGYRFSPPKYTQNVTKKSSQ